MRIVFIADGRSPTTKSWIAAAAAYGDEIHLITTYPCRADRGNYKHDLSSAGLQPGGTRSEGNCLPIPQQQNLLREGNQPWEI